METSSQLSDSLVPFERVAKFVRQLTHDVRNGLSAIDLEAAFIAELVTDPESADEVRKLRSMVSNTAKMLKDISQFFQPVSVNTMPWQASVFFEELQGRVAKAFAEENGNVKFSSALNEESVVIDLEQVITAVIHVLRNAIQFRKDPSPITVGMKCENDKLVIEICEVKPEDFASQAPPEEWGLDPLRTTRPGGYGLGLFRVRQILEAHDGALESHLVGNTLVTRMLLPVCAA